MTIVHTAIKIAVNAPPIALMMCASFSHAYQKRTTSSGNGFVRFSVDPLIIGLCLICIPIFLYWAIAASTKFDFASHSLDLISRINEVVILGWLGIGLLFSLPRTLIVSAEGIEQQFWLKANRQVLWTKIATIIVGEYRVEVIASNGKKVVHERFHLDRERFLLELKKYCTEEEFAERLDQNVAMARR